VRADNSIAAMAADGTWLAHRYDAVGDGYHMRHLSRDAHDAATFITDEYLVNDPNTVVVDRRKMVDALPTGTALHFIIHSAFCASTMLARGFNLPGVSMGLKEPVLLNDIVGWRRRGAEPKAVAERLDHGLRMLSRPFGHDTAVIVKPSNVFNSLVPAALTIRPEAKAVLLHAPLPVFLISVARKGLWCRLWCRELLEGLLTDGIVDLGFGPQDYFRQSDLQVAAVGWLAQHRLFASLATKFGPERISTLDSERLTADPMAALVSAGKFFGLNMPQIDVGKSNAFTTHSKSGGNFTTADRVVEHKAAAEAHADEIEKVLVWAEAVAKAADIDMVLQDPLRF
jgi:hypothetical protein